MSGDVTIATIAFNQNVKIGKRKIVFYFNGELNMRAYSVKMRVKVIDMIFVENAERVVNIPQPKSR